MGRGGTVISRFSRRKTVRKQRLDQSPALLRSSTKEISKSGVNHVWIDTCCIDKASSAELSEAINSMWSWYEKSFICMAFMNDVTLFQRQSYGGVGRFSQSEWFKRGWTLQELLAPRFLEFFTRDWSYFGSRAKLASEIVAATGIAEKAISGGEANMARGFSVATRMSWASMRVTTRPEDRAYSLMGLLNVNMPLLYGEGKEKAFTRLQLEILKDSDDESLFAWDAPETRSGMLAEDPSDFHLSQQIFPMEFIEERPPYSMTNKGLNIELALDLYFPFGGHGPGIPRAVLNCGRTSDSKEEERMAYACVIYLLQSGNRYFRIGRLGTVNRITPPAECDSRSIYIQNDHKYLRKQQVKLIQGPCPLRQHKLWEKRSRESKADVLREFGMLLELYQETGVVDETGIDVERRHSCDCTEKYFSHTAIRNALTYLTEYDDSSSEDEYLRVARLHDFTL